MSFRITLRSRKKEDLERRIKESEERGWQIVRTNVADTSIVTSKHKEPHKLYVAVMERDNDGYKSSGKNRGGWGSAPTNWY